MIRRPNFKTVAGGMLVLLALLAVSTSAFAQLPNVGGVPAYAPPFDTIGFIQDAGLGSTPGVKAPFSATNRTQGGWMYVNGHLIIVPQNTTLQMPAVELTWADLFDPAIGPQTAGGSETGLAIADTGSSKLVGTFEVHVQGNIVNGTYISGLIFIAQQSLNSANGFVDHIDYAKGDIYVSGGPGGSLVRLQINDPIGRFGMAHSPDGRFSVDEDNPTIHAETGYPMCVPRYDPAQQQDNLCPQYNRPPNAAGGYVMNFTMPAPAARRAGAVPPDPDARVMAPFEPGDYLTYSGTIFPDSTQPSGYYVSVYNIDANVGIYTAPNSDPVYVVIGEFEQGTGGIANVAFPQETTSRVKVEGMSTDSAVTRFVNIGARDTDCNGIVKDRTAWVTNFPIDPGPPTGAKRGRIRWRTNGGPFLPPAKEIHVIAQGANTFTPQANGLFPGQYYAPEFSFIFPENLGVGDPPITLNLGDFVYLVNGVGPFETDAAGNTPVIGQLSPWPDLVAPAPTCTYNAATANAVLTGDAGGPYSLALVSGGANSVTLSGSYTPPAISGLYNWTLLNPDPNVSFTGTSTAAPTLSIINPALVTTPVTYQVSLVVQDSANPLQQSTAAVATISVSPMVQSPVISSMIATPTSVALGQPFSVAVSAFDPAGLPLTYTYTPSACATLTGGQGTASAAFLAGNTATAACSVSVSVSNGSAAPPAVRSVNVGIVNPAGNAPAITRITATPSPAVSNGNITLSAAVNNPGGLPLSYAWTITAPAGTAGFPLTLTGATPTFVAPTVTFAQRSITLGLSLTVTNAAGSNSSATSVNVVAPPADVLTDGGTVYRQAKSRLTVNVNSSVVSPSIVLTATLDLVNPATNQKFSGTMTNLGGGVYTLDFIGVGLPNTINVVSTGGGTLTINRAAIAIK